MEKELGSGNYATVFKAKELATGDTVAIKSVKKDVVRKSQRSVESISEEINAMRGVRHPYICSLFAVFEDLDHIHLVMEYCAGGELFKRIVNK